MPYQFDKFSNLFAISHSLLLSVKALEKIITLPLDVSKASTYTDAEHDAPHNGASGARWHLLEPTDGVFYSISDLFARRIVAR
jgi:hypothetical protein